jgi:hypothetical protein
MFFSGDPTSKRKVDLGGRSSKERDRGKLLEAARLERKKRERFRLETQSAVKIQVSHFFCSLFVSFSCTTFCVSGRLQHSLVNDPANLIIM